MQEWRIIDIRIDSCYNNMGLDEAIMTAYAEGKGVADGTVRFYRWNPSAVSIGYFQSMEQELDLEECKNRGVDYIRRVTGGGAVYHDFEGELTYSLITPQSNSIIPRDILKSYEVICGALVDGLRRLGVTAVFEPVNDLTAAGRKISGNAQTRRKDVVLQHGTLLRKVNVEKMFSLLRVSDEKIRDKLITSVRDRVCSLEDYLDKDVLFSELKNALTAGFENVLDIRFIPGQPTDYELKLASQLAQTKASHEWLFMR